MSGLRERRRVETRQLIIDAVHQVLVDEHPSDLSMPRVAEAAGIGLRTLYRYFPTKSDLVDAASRSYQTEVDAEYGAPADVDDLEGYLIAMWRSFDEALPAVMAQHSTPAGRELRRSRLDRSRAQVTAALGQAGLTLTGDELERVVDTVVLLTSSTAYLELTQHLGHASDDAARLAVAATRAVIADADGDR